MVSADPARQLDDSGAARFSEAGCSRTTRAPSSRARLDAERTACARGRRPEQTPRERK